jgi:hypothetical protein
MKNNILNKELSAEEQELILNHLGMSIIDGVIYDDDGDEFYGNPQNDKYSFETIEGVFLYIKERNYAYGYSSGAFGVKHALRKLLELP